MEDKVYRLQWRRFVHPIEYNHGVDDKSDSDTYNGDFENIKQGYYGPVLVGKNGVMPTSNNMLPNKSYNLWIADSNFKWPENTTNILNYHVDGVEAFEYLTPYQLLIAVARLFDDSYVKKEFENRILEYMNSTRSKIKNKLYKSIYKFSAKAIDPNTKLGIVLSGETKEELDNKIKEFIKLNPQAIIEE